MQENGFAWWKQRFEQMSNYFDAFRIDHILVSSAYGAFQSMQYRGIMGRFIPCLPVHINEFGEKGICSITSGIAARSLQMKCWKRSLVIWRMM
jgi:4-alpha-glucanotransferase